MDSEKCKDIHSEWSAALRAPAMRSGDPFQWVRSLDGKIYRLFANRRTLRFEQDDRSYFLKWHGGIGWAEVFKNWLLLRWPVTGARPEYEAIRHCEQLGVPTMHIAGFGEKGRNPAAMESFLITDEIAPAISLEDYCRHWPTQAPARHERRALIIALAQLTRRLHEGGINHRDFYLCHWLLHIDPASGKPVDPLSPQLALIDLHRAQKRDAVPRRWLVKDLGSLYFSAMDCGLSQRDLLLFLQHYRAGSASAEVRRNGAFWQQVQQRADALYDKMWKKPAPQIMPRQRHAS